MTPRHGHLIPALLAAAACGLSGNQSSQPADWEAQRLRMVEHQRRALEFYALKQHEGRRERDIQFAE